MLITAPTKIRTNVYLDAEIKKQAKEVFKKYGVSLSDARRKVSHLEKEK